MNGSLGGRENTRANLQPNEIPTSRGPCPCSIPSRRGGPGRACKERERFRDACRRVPAGGWVGDRYVCVPEGLPRLPQRSRVTKAPCRCCGSRSPEPAEEATDKGFRRPVSMLAPLQAEQQLPRCRRPRAAVAEGLRACTPAPPAGFHSAFPAPPGCAGRLPQEDGSPLRNRAADGTPSAMGRTEGGRAGARTTRGGGCRPRRLGDREGSPPGPGLLCPLSAAGREQLPAAVPCR